jgi:abortive infection bacteriophage resistance protein
MVSSTIMTLDVTFYSNLQYIEHAIEGDDCCNDVLHVWAYAEFAGHYAPLKPGYYTGDVVASFEAGSYDWYNKWRAELCKKAIVVDMKKVWNDPEKYKDAPFYWLVDFADNEGVIAGDAFEKLREDFKAIDITFDDGIGNQKFKQWKEAFSIDEARCVKFC